MTTKAAFKKQHMVNYVLVKTKTTPPTLSIKQASKLSKRGESYIIDEIARGNLNFGYIDDFSQEKQDNGSIDENNMGSKVVIMDTTWDEWLNRKNQKDQ